MMPPAAYAATYGSSRSRQGRLRLILASLRNSQSTQDAQGCRRCAIAVAFRGRFRALGVCTGWMMSASSIGAGRGGGYARYLEGKTVAPERGDYYLTPGGELAEAPGSWLSAPETLARLGVEPAAPVDGADFIALMEGRHPGSGLWLRRAGADGARGGRMGG